MSTYNGEWSAQDGSEVPNPITRDFRGQAPKRQLRLRACKWSVLWRSKRDALVCVCVCARVHACVQERALRGAGRGAVRHGMVEPGVSPAGHGCSPCCSVLAAVCDVWMPLGGWARAGEGWCPPPTPGLGQRALWKEVLPGPWPPTWASIFFSWSLVSSPRWAQAGLAGAKRSGLPRPSRV